MKNLYLVLIFNIINIINVYSEDWNIISYNHAEFYNIDGIDSLNYIISEDFGQMIDNVPVMYTSIKRTYDGGKSWNIIWRCDWKSPGDPDPRWITCLKMLSENTFVAFARGGLIIRTTNAGETWDSTFIEVKESENYCSAFDFYKGNYGLASVQDLKYLLVTEDSGKTWNKMDLPVLEGPGNDYLPFDIKILNDSVIVINYYSYPEKKQYIFRTENRGKSWKTIEASTHMTPIMEFLNETTGWMCGMKEEQVDWAPVIMKTTDGGRTWNYIMLCDSCRPGGVFSLAVIDENNIIGVSLHCIYRTTNGGETWYEETYQKTDTITGFNRIFFGGKTTGLILAGHYYVYSNNFKLDVNDCPALIDGEIYAYPNPMSGNNINVDVNLKSYARIRLELYNSIGDAIGSKFTAEHTSGIQTIKYEPGINLLPGVYYLNITINDKIRTVKKIVIID